MERHPELRDVDLAYSAVTSLSEKDATRIRALLAEIVRKTDGIVGPSPSEKLDCMGIDRFEV